MWRLPPCAFLGDNRAFLPEIRCHGWAGWRRWRTEQDRNGCGGYSLAVMTWSGQQLRATQNSPCFGLPLLHWSNGECLSRRTPSGLLAPSRISSGFSKLPSESACPRFRFTGTPGGSLPSSMLHRNTSHRDGAQGEGAEGSSTFSSPSASRSPSGSSSTCSESIELQR